MCAFWIRGNFTVQYAGLNLQKNRVRGTKRLMRTGLNEKG
jgi:hypothetical protein